MGYSPWGPKESDMTERQTLVSCVCLSTVIKIYNDIRNELVMTTWVLSEFKESWEFCDKDVLKKGSFHSEMSHPHPICPKLVFPLTFLSTNSVGASTANNGFPLYQFFPNSDFIDESPLFHIWFT